MVLKRDGATSKLLKVKAPDGASLTVTKDVVDHVIRKHSEILSLLGLTRNGFVKLLRSALEEPSEAYVDVYGSRYFLRRLNDLYLNAVVSEDALRTAYLISSENVL
jgi:hypothetical protein